MAHVPVRPTTCNISVAAPSSAPGTNTFPERSRFHFANLGWSPASAHYSRSSQPPFFLRHPDRLHPNSRHPERSRVLAAESMDLLFACTATPFRPFTTLVIPRRSRGTSQLPSHHHTPSGPWCPTFAWLPSVCCPPFQLRPAHRRSSKPFSSRNVSPPRSLAARSCFSRRTRNKRQLLRFVAAIVPRTVRSTSVPAVPAVLPRLARSRIPPVGVPQQKSPARRSPMQGLKSASSSELPAGLVSLTMTCFFIYLWITPTTLPSAFCARPVTEIPFFIS